MAIKRMKFERSGGRKAAEAAALTSPSPPPEQSIAFAKKGIEVARGNSNLQKLSPQGESQAEEVGQKLADKTPTDTPLKVVSSPAVRAEQTASAIEKASPATVEHSDDPRLESWAQGNLEGKPRELVKDQINNLIRQNPGFKLPGKGALSTRPGESFDDFRQRFLSSIRGVMQQKANEPHKTLVVPTHSSGINLVHAWLANGAPDDLSIKPEEMDRPYGPPGSVVELKPDQHGKWSANELDLNSRELIDPSSILLARHGMTPENKENYDHAEGAQMALAQVAKHAKSLDFGRARAVAQKAVEAGHLTDPEVDDAIDNALPSKKEAADLPMHHLLGVVSAASPKKQKDYAPLVQDYFNNGAIGQLPPDAKNALVSHLSQIGLPPAQA
jgi:broad specificity phosphatase PhoE